MKMESQGLAKIKYLKRNIVILKFFILIGRKFKIIRFSIILN